MSLLWGSVSYVAAVFVGVWLVALRGEKRSLFWVRSALCLVWACLVVWGYDAAIRLLADYETLFFILRMCDCLCVVAVMMVSVAVCFHCDLWAVLFCVTAGYCMQHIAKTITYIVELLPGIDSEMLSAVVLLAVSAAVYAAIYFLVIRRKNVGNISVDNAMQILVALIVMITSIFIYLIALRFVPKSEDGSVLRVLIQLFSMIVAILSFCLEFGLLSNHRLMDERDTIRRLLEKENEQYQIDQERIELINMKCHDIKYHLALLKDMQGSEERTRYVHELEKLVMFFENNYKTGNKTLDMLLAEKVLVCEQNHIRFSCIADGQSLNFMEGLDIYSLFGNAVNNAIESAKNVKDEQKRLISLKISAKNKFLCINVENYYEHAIVFAGGLPQTTKGDRAWHGFGMRSIRHTVEKYNGNLVIDTKNNIFSLGIYIPLAA